MNLMQPAVLKELMSLNTKLFPPAIVFRPREAIFEVIQLSLLCRPARHFKIPVLALESSRVEIAYVNCTRDCLVPPLGQTRAEPLIWPIHSGCLG